MESSLRPSTHLDAHYHAAADFVCDSIYNKEQEFRAWLVEERMLNPETISKDQNKKEFARFVEDFNTGTRYLGILYMSTDISRHSHSTP